jgi:hypothetical protein
MFLRVKMLLECLPLQTCATFEAVCFLYQSKGIRTQFLFTWVFFIYKKRDPRKAAGVRTNMMILAVHHRLSPFLGDVSGSTWKARRWSDGSASLPGCTLLGSRNWLLMVMGTPCNGQESNWTDRQSNINTASSHPDTVRFMPAWQATVHAELGSYGHWVWNSTSHVWDWIRP